ncbi:MAG: acyltransferase domain-containing protein [Microcystis wesenbergii Mw_QC_B_20070930_S4]|jgi:acyl transferase domain-containing protein/thioesterase domain-containing protein|nr:MAG: acyltransferase domain-containing protein [Microcystis wesenbergii Mw_QC_B_20070930_S4D]TRV14839.1 MAG: acyltransferase domain-containing protein [Microcystis wesenbergii Mw_QC_B_20070930_S4]
MENNLDKIAVIGMNCRFPGGANNPDAYWHLLQTGKDGIQPIPPERWRVEDYYSSEPDQPGKMYTRQGGFLEQIDHFDPVFFNIKPLEAVQMDPQQRLILEVGYLALENAGQPPGSLKGSKTGVFIGICFDDYARLTINSGFPERITPYSCLGNSKSIAAGRLSYVLGLQGPAMAIDTSCSSSLLAIHLACKSLLLGESDLALAGGVNLMLSPENTIGFCTLKALSPTDRCKTFDVSADGYVRGEGCGIVVLKRLEEAISHRDPILAVIRSSATNHDGPSNGMTAPNGLAQEAVIRQALLTAKVEPEYVQYVETHGTGTVLGDPIEVSALGNVLGKNRSKDNPLWIGSVKTNFGHLEGAAGVASFMKVVLALQHRAIPPHLHLTTPNPYIPWNKLPFKVPTELTPWPSGKPSRLGGVSSFGMSGTNVHVILEEAPTIPSLPSSRPWQLLVLSAKTPTSLERTSVKLTEYLHQHSSNIDLADVAFTLSGGRQVFPYRRIMLCRHLDQGSGRRIEMTQETSCESKVEGKRPLAFMFPGQGTQSINMGLDLYRNEPDFRQPFDRCAEILQPLLGFDLRRVIYPDCWQEKAVNLLQQTVVAQPALFVFEFALAQLWMEWGIQPQMMIGHSIGEYVAACLAGVFSPEDALRLVTVRAKLMQRCPTGAMLAVSLAPEEIQDLIERWNQENSSLKARLSLAAINSPQQCVISGDITAIESLAALLNSRNTPYHRLNTSHAFHSHLMESILDEFTDEVKSVNLNPPKIPVVSNVTGCWLSPEEAVDPDYWTKHLRHTVYFAQGVQQLLKNPDIIALEVGQGATLSQLAKKMASSSNHLFLSSLPKPGGQQITVTEDSFKHLLMTLGQLWLAGVSPDWEKFYSGEQRRYLQLPTYSFDYQRYWLDFKSSAPLAVSIQDSKEITATPSISSSNKKLANSPASVYNDLENLLITILQESLALESLDVKDNFFDLGGDSLLAIQLISQLNKQFQVQLNQNQLMKSPTVATLALMIEQARSGERGASNASLVEIQPKGNKRPLFCIHPAGGNVFCYLNLVNYLGSEQPIYGLEDPNLFLEEKRHFTFLEKAQYYMKLIQTVQNKGPFLLLGYSYGGNMAFEIALQFEKQGHQVLFLGLIDSFPPISYQNIAIEDTKLLAAIWQMIGLMFDKKQRSWFNELKQIKPHKRLDYVVKKLLSDASGIAIPDDFLNSSLLKVAMNNFRELHDYIPQEIYPGKITYFWAEQKIPQSLIRLLNYQIPDDLLGDGWSHFSSQAIENHYVPGHHFTLFNKANFPRLARIIQQCLVQSQETCQ